jgi:hypothetical protein
MDGDALMPGKPPYIGEDIQQAIKLTAEGLDYETVDGKTLVSHIFWASKELDKMAAQMKWFSAVAREYPFLFQDSDSLESGFKFICQVMNLSVYLFAVLKVAVPEFIERVQSNGVNRNFGLLKIAHDSGDMDTQQMTMGVLYRVGCTIARKNGWFHPEQNDGWKGIVDMAVAKELDKLRNMDTVSTLEMMADNKFAMFWNVLQADITDETRRLVRQPKTKSIEGFPEEDAVFLSHRSNPEEQETRQSAIRLLRNRAGGYREKYGVFLEVAADCLADPPDGIVSKMRAELVDRATKLRNVSPQQARKDRREMEQCKEQFQEVIEALGKKS